MPSITGSEERRCDASAEELWQLPAASPTQEVGAAWLMLVTGAPGAKYMSLAPESTMAVSEIWAALPRGGGMGAAKHL